MKSQFQPGVPPASVRCLLALACVLAGTLPSMAQDPESPPGDLRTVRPLASGWRFVLDDAVTEEAALASPGDEWQSVTLPHTWNAHDAATTNAMAPYRRGRGWYRLVFAGPTAGTRHWLEFQGASIVADVWLNGTRLGQHKGAFTAFRFDVTAVLRPADNVLVVKTDNSAPRTDDDVTAIAPLSGDFNMPGGLYRMVTLVSTQSEVHLAMDDFGGSGVYARTVDIGTPARVNVRAKAVNDGRAAGTYAVRSTLLDASGRVAAEGRTTIALPAQGRSDSTQDLSIAAPRLWHGTRDPYLYTLRVEVVDVKGAVLDRVSQRIGIRQMDFDPDRGFSLNGQAVALHGVAMHQDHLGKAWAITDQDTDASLALVKEIGANTIRLAHYPHARHTLERADELGLVVWAEVGFVNGVRLSCANEPATEAFVTNVEQQLRELITQQFNHASIAMWSIGNENTMTQGRCGGADNVTPVLRRLHQVAKGEDPGRVTTLADLSLGGRGEGPIRVSGISDVWGLNRYHLWYYGDLDSLARDVDELHARYPTQPFGISEYGAGAAVSDHTDNPLGGPPTPYGTANTRVYQPEEYAAFVHEHSYAVLSARPFIWGTYVWAMFDFGSGIRYEGDLRGVNTKGLVTFDREIRKDPFYFYKANWSADPVTHIVGRRYTDRAYAVTDVKVYTNADAVDLTVNGTPVGSRSAAQCQFRTCVFEDVALRVGKNVVTARGTRGTEASTDEVVWTLSDAGHVNIAAGQLATGLRASDGTRFGSDNFFSGGTGRKVVQPSRRGEGDTSPVKGVAGPADAALFATYREGRFKYVIPLGNGTYRVVLGFVEPSKDMPVGGRVFDVEVNGAKAIAGFDVVREAGAYRTVVTKAIVVTVTDGRLELAFAPTTGEAVVSNIAVSRQ